MPVNVLTAARGPAEVLRGVEALAIFLKDHVAPGGVPPQSHIKFEAVRSV